MTRNEDGNTNHNNDIDMILMVLGDFDDVGTTLYYYIPYMNCEDTKTVIRVDL